MPLKRDVPYCINHPGTRLRQDREFAERIKPTSLRFWWATRADNMPINMYVCPRCGYVEMYAAGIELEKHVDEPERPWPFTLFAGSSVLSALDFDSAVLDALQSGVPPFSGARVTPAVQLEEGDRTHTIDAVVQLRHKLYVVEIKSAVSKSIIHETVHAAMDRAAAYSKSTLAAGKRARPLVIVPHGAKITRSLHGVPIIRFDQDTGRFVGRLLGSSPNAG